MIEQNKGAVPAIPPPEPLSGRPIIEVTDLVKRFDSLTAVNKIGFEVQEGEIFGFLGPNGAGKSTTIKVLCTLVKPTEGSVRVAGYDVTAQPDGCASKLGLFSRTPPWIAV